MDNMLTVDDKGVGQGQVAVQEDLLIGFEFDDKIGDVLLLINRKDEDLKVLEVTQRAPLNIAVVEAIGSCLGFDSSCHNSFSSLIKVPFRGAPSIASSRQVLQPLLIRHSRATSSFYDMTHKLQRARGT